MNPIDEQMGQPTIPEPEETAPEQAVEPVTPAPKKFSSIIKVKLTPSQKEQMITLIKEEMEKTLETYANFGNGKGWFNHLSITDAEYDPDLSFENADTPEKKKLLLTMIMSEIVASKEKRQTWGATPVILLEKEEDVQDEDVRNHEDLLDFRLRTYCKMQELDYAATRKSCANGVSLIKIPYEKNTEYVTRRTLYKIEPESVAKFEERYSGELMNPQSKAFQNWQLLQSGQEVDITDIEPIVCYNGPKPKRVDPKKFFARLDIADFRDHKVISELIDTFTWADIEKRTAQDDNDAYGYDKEAVDELKEKLGKDYTKSENTVYESIVYIKLKTELKEGEAPKTERHQRYLVTFEDTHKIVLRCIHYPYEHNKIIYVSKCAMPRDDSWAGYSFSSRLKDMRSMGEGLINSLMNEFKLAENGIVLTDDDRTDFERLSINNGDGMSVVKFTPGKTFQQFNWAFPNTDRIGLINWVNNFAALLTGVDPMLNSGAQTPDDPRAPLGKVAIKAQASNMRIEDVINNLQKADEEVAEQVDKDYYQFVDGDSEDKKISYYRGGSQKTVAYDTVGKKVRYVCHGSRLSFDKATDNQSIMGFMGFMAKAAPQQYQDADIQLALWTALVNNTEGSIERNKDILLKPFRQIADAKKAILVYRQKRKAEGASDEQVASELRMMMGGGQQGMAPGASPEMPPPQPRQPGPPTEVIQ